MTHVCARVVGVLLVAMLAGCGSAERGVDPVGENPAPADAESYEPDVEAVEPVIYKSAMRAFGEDVAQSGVRAAMDLIMSTGYSETLMRKHPAADDEVERLADRMAPKARRGWLRVVRAYNKAAAGERMNPDIVTGVYSLAYYDIDSGLGGSGATLAPDGAAVPRVDIASIEAKEDTGRLAVTVDSTADFRVTDGEEVREWPLTREVTYFLIPPQGEGEWVIDGWYGNYDVGDWPFEARD